MHSPPSMPLSPSTLMIAAAFRCAGQHGNGPPASERSSDVSRSPTRRCARPPTPSARYVGSYTGRVIRASDGTPVADAVVSVLPVDERARTDSTGRFQFFGLGAGRQLIEIRRIGFAAMRDTVTLKARDQATRDFSLTEQAVSLDTVRTKGDVVKYISPALQGFEARRAE